VLTVSLTACSVAGIRLLSASGRATPYAQKLDSLAVTAPPSATGDAAIAAAPATFTGPARLQAPPARLAARSTGTQSGTWAVVIGINDYPGTAHDLSSAVPDAEEMNRALEALGVPADHRLLITEGQATARVIGTAADWLVARAGRDAKAVFFFAGHVRKQSATIEAMIGADGGTVTDAQLAKRLAPLQAGRLWVAMAACYGGGFTEVLRPGVVLTGAAAANERAYESAEFNRSYMVEFMVRQAMVQGRASESVQAAYAYARSALAPAHANRMPVQFDQGTGPLDLRPPGFRPAPKPTVAPTVSASDAGTGTSTSTSTGGGGGSTATTTAGTSSTTTPAPRRCTTLGVPTPCT
jgi:caspase domain-containing protein